METLQSSQAQSQALAEKLLKVGAQEAVQDARLGTIIDLMA
jgi:hypothetical protein